MSTHDSGDSKFVPSTVASDENCPFTAEELEFLSEHFVPRETHEREITRRDERIEELEDEREELQERVDDLEDYKRTHEKQHDSLTTLLDDRTDRICELEDAVERGGFVAETDNDPSPDDLPIEQMVDLPRAVAEDALSSNDLRARYLWENWESLSRSNGPRGGTVLKATDALKALRTAEGKPTLESKTRERVFKRIVSYSGGLVQAKKKDGEWRLVRPTNWRDQAEDRTSTAWKDAPKSLGELGGSVASGVVQ